MRTNESFCYEPDKLAEWRLRWWRGEFYDWHKGRYTRLDDDNLSAIVAGFLQDSNRPKFGYEPPDPPIKVTSGLVRNILLNISGFEGVYISDRRELSTWPPDEKLAGGNNHDIVSQRPCYVRRRRDRQLDVIARSESR